MIIPTTEPSLIYAGYTLQWTKSLADYPAPTWTLVYALFNATEAYTINTTPSATSHAVSVAAATTQGWVSGRYTWNSYVESGVERFPVAVGRMIIKPNPATGQPIDARSHARRMLDAIEAVLEDRATAGDLDVITAAAPSFSTTNSPKMLIELRDKFRQEVAREERAEAIARGENRPRNIRVRHS